LELISDANVFEQYRRGSTIGNKDIVRQVSNNKNLNVIFKKHYDFTFSLNNTRPYTTFLRCSEVKPLSLTFLKHDL